MLGGGCHPGLVYAEDRATTRVQLEKSGQKLTDYSGESGPSNPSPRRRQRSRSHHAPWCTWMARTVLSTSSVSDARLQALEKWKSEETRKTGSDEGSNWPKMDQKLTKKDEKVEK
jgi:hypothetical protein